MRDGDFDLIKDEVVRGARKLRADEMTDYDNLFESIGDASFVLIGEASHGTHQFYRERAEITKRLITEKGFSAVAVEADFPDAHRVDRYVRGRGQDRDAVDALSGFKRFPAWMWRNADVLDFVGWLRSHNDDLSQGEQNVGFYGLDLYSLYSSIEAVLAYLDKIDPEAASRARDRYSCFEHFGEDTQAYGYATAFGISESCEKDVVEQLSELNRRAGELAHRDGRVAEDEYFMAEQNARLVKNAEEYYRVMYRSDISSWNLRDRHMVETLVMLEKHLGPRSKIVLWEHNSHLGDARATEMGRRGEWNVGQLVREIYADASYLIGFTTYSGTVTAATNWGDQAERKRVRNALDGSVEDLFHRVGQDRFYLTFAGNEQLHKALRTPMLERAIGVIYRPETERQSHYFETRLSDQFNAVIHIDETRAVEPLERTAEWERGEPAETFPFGV
ncbi:MAG TPA: erythromycin esterase family protein [Pyrinomonadaceae bacterium]